MAAWAREARGWEESPSGLGLVHWEHGPRRALTLTGPLLGWKVPACRVSGAGPRAHAQGSALRTRTSQARGSQAVCPFSDLPRALGEGPSPSSGVSFLPIIGGTPGPAVFPCPGQGSVKRLIAKPSAAFIKKNGAAYFPQSFWRV